MDTRQVIGYAALALLAGLILFALLMVRLNKRRKKRRNNHWNQIEL